jgi:hypothetical protein
MVRDVYTADMGQPPIEDDMGSIEELQLRNKRRPVGGRGAPPAPMAPPRPRPNPADANIYTADKGMPPSPDDMGSIERIRPKTSRQKKAAKDIKAAMGMKKGGSVSSASKRADGCATKGKTKGRFV